jgi:phosphoglycerate dehydrogenase-like enzyme
MGMKVIAYDIDQTKSMESVEMRDSYASVLQDSDILLIAVHLSEQTLGMVDKSWFNIMKQGVYFINISRGDILVEKDFIEALENKTIEAAGLDVISNENSNDILHSEVLNYARSHDNLIVTPHIAGLTFDSERKAAAHSLDYIKEYFSA